MKKLLLLFIPLVFFFGCEEEENVDIVGCMDINACNYNPEATTPVDSCSCPGYMAGFFLMADEICCLMPGCWELTWDFETEIFDTIILNDDCVWIFD